MNFKNTIVLFITTLLLIGLLIFIKYYQKSEIPEKSYIFSHINIKDVDSIQLINYGKKYKINKINNNWKLLLPFKDMADDDKINNFLKTLETTKIEEVYKISDLNLEKINFVEKNNFQIKIFINGSKKFEAFFRRDTTMDGKTYLQMVSPSKYRKKILLMNFDINKIIPKNLDEIRSKNLLNIEKDQVAKISIKNYKGEILIERDNENFSLWRIKKPLLAEVSTRKVKEFINKLINTKVQEFMSDDQALRENIVLPSRASEISITTFKPNDLHKDLLKSNNPQKENKKTNLKNNKEKSISTDTQSQTKFIIKNHLIRFQNTDITKGKIYTRILNRTGVVSVSNDIIKLLNMSPNDFRERTITKIDKQLIKKISIKKSSNNQKEINSNNINKHDEIILEKINKDWNYSYKNYTSSADKILINEFIDRLNMEGVKKFVSNSTIETNKYGLDKPFLTLTINSTTTNSDNPNLKNENSKITKINFSHNNNGEFFANEEKSPFISNINKDFLQSIQTSPYYWKNRQIFGFSSTRLENILIKYNKINSNLLIKQDFLSGEWYASIINNRQFNKTSRSLSKINNNYFKKANSLSTNSKKNKIELDFNSLNNFVNTLSELKALTWISKPIEALSYLKKPEVTIYFTLKNLNLSRNDNLPSKTHILKIIQDKKNDLIYYGKLNTTPEVFTISRKSFNNLRRKILKNNK